MDKQSGHLSALLENDLGIGSEYRHVAKRVTSGEAVETPGALLKWYAVYREDQRIPG